MTEKQITITPPEGYQIDTENSTFQCIKFKPIEKPKRWVDNTNKRISGYFVGNNCAITYLNNVQNVSNNYNIFATEKQAKSALAMARISQIMMNDPRFGGVVTDEEWEDTEGVYKSVIQRTGNNIAKSGYLGNYHFLAFHTAEQRNLFLEENEQLVKDYLMID